MSETNSPVPATMVVSGLLADAPDTASGLVDRVERQFPNAHFSPSGIFHAVRRLREGGLICVVPGDEHRRVQRLRPTDLGLRRFERWMHRQSEAAAELRDPILTRLCLCREVRELRRLIDSIEKEAEACELQQATARSRLASMHQRSLRLDSAPAAPGVLSARDRAEVDCLALASEVAFWTSRSLAMRKLHRALDEKLAQLVEAEEEQQEAS